MREREKERETFLPKLNLNFSFFIHVNAVIFKLFIVFRMKIRHNINGYPAIQLLNYLVRFYPFYDLLFKMGQDFLDAQ